MIYAVFYWLLLAAFTYTVSPGNSIAFFIFYCLIALSLISTLHIILSRPISIVVSFFCVGYLFLRHLHVDTILTLSLLAAVTVAIGFYFRKGTHK